MRYILVFVGSNLPFPSVWFMTIFVLSFGRKLIVIWLVSACTKCFRMDKIERETLASSLQLGNDIAIFRVKKNKTIKTNQTQNEKFKSFKSKSDESSARSCSPKNGWCPCIITPCARWNKTLFIANEGYTILQAWVKANFSLLFESDLPVKDVLLWTTPNFLVHVMYNEPLLSPLKAS